MITLLNISNHGQELLDAAIVEAKRWKGLEKVEIWDPTPNLEILPQWKVEERSDSLSSLMTFSEGSDVVWKNNQKFAWV